MLHSHECGKAGREKVRRVRRVGRFLLTLWGDIEIETMNPDHRVQARWDGESRAVIGPTDRREDIGHELE